jgi:hypothetical protein
VEHDTLEQVSPMAQPTWAAPFVAICSTIQMNIVVFHTFHLVKVVRKLKERYV